MRTGQNGQLCPTEVPNFGDENGPHWIGFQFRSGFSVAQILVVELDFIGVDELSAWVYRGDSLVKKVPAISWQTPLSQRDVPHRVSAFRFVAQPGQTYSCLIRLQKQAGVLVAPLTLFTEADFVANTIRTNLLHGIASGCLLLAILLGLSFWLLTKQVQYGYYAWYVLGILLFLLEEQGYLNGFIVGHSDLLAGPNAWAIFSLLAMIGHTLFVIRFLRLNQLTARGWAWLGWAVCTLCSVLLSFLLLGQSSDMLHHLTLAMNAVYALLLFVYLFVALHYKRPESTLYLMAISPFFLTVLWVCLARFGWLPENWLLYNLLNYSPVWEVALLCVGLAFTFSRTQQQRLLALEETTRLRTQFIQEMDNAQESERRRIAQDLHDDVGNTLAAVKGLLGTIANKLLIRTEFPQVSNARVLIEKASQDLRTISHNLMPVEFKKYTLSDVVQQTVERANAALNNPTNHAVSGQPKGRPAVHFEFIQAGTQRSLTPERSLVVYRIVNELINNILKHSQATVATVQMVFQPESLVVTVEDNGNGFQTQNSGNPAPGIGLKNVLFRSNYIGATLDISSDASGTCVIVEIPYV